MLCVMAALIFHHPNSGRFMSDLKNYQNISSRDIWELIPEAQFNSFISSALLCAFSQALMSAVSFTILKEWRPKIDLISVTSGSRLLLMTFFAVVRFEALAAVE